MIDDNDIDDLLDFLEDNAGLDGQFDKRQHERRIYNIPILFLTSGPNNKLVLDPSRKGKAVTMNISSGGCRISTPEAFFVGDTINLLGLDKKKFFSPKIIVRHYEKTPEGFLYGCEFISLNKREDVRLPS